MWGVLHSMSDVLNKHFQNVLNLSISNSGLIQFSVFGAYFIMSIPAGLFMKKYGYKPGGYTGACLICRRFVFICTSCQRGFVYLFQDSVVYCGLR